MKQTVFNKLYHRIQEEPRIYGLTFPELILVMVVLLIGTQVGRPLGILLSLGVAFGLAAVAYLFFTRRAKAKIGLGNDKLAHLIKSACASNENSNERFEILEKRESNASKKKKGKRT